MNRFSVSLSPGKQELALLDRNSISNAFTNCVSQDEGEMKALNTVSAGKEETLQHNFSRPSPPFYMSVDAFVRVLAICHIYEIRS